MLERSAPRGVALVVGTGEGIWSRGVASDAVFEIGSISKTFTATLRAGMMRDGLVAPGHRAADPGPHGTRAPGAQLGPGGALQHGPVGHPLRGQAVSGGDGELIGQHALERGHLERRREQVALAGVAAELAQVGELGLVLDALGDRPQPERAAELDERLDQRVRLVRAGGGGDERAVDLQRVDRQLLQVGERGVAGAEVVDRDVQAVGRAARAAARRRPPGRASARSR